MNDRSLHHVRQGPIEQHYAILKASSQRSKRARIMQDIHQKHLVCRATYNSISGADRHALTPDRRSRYAHYRAFLKELVQKMHYDIVCDRRDVGRVNSLQLSELYIYDRSLTRNYWNLWPADIFREIKLL